FLVTAQHRLDRHVENAGRFGLRQVLIPEQLEDLALVLGQRLDRAVELGPLRQQSRLTALVRRIEWWSARRAVRDRSGAVVMGAPAVRAEMVPGQVEQGAADLQRRQGEEAEGRSGSFVLQGQAEAAHGFLEDVAGVVPTAHAWELATEHVVRS